MSLTMDIFFFPNKTSEFFQAGVMMAYEGRFCGTRLAMEKHHHLECFFQFNKIETAKALYLMGRGGKEALLYAG